MLNAFSWCRQLSEERRHKVLLPKAMWVRLNSEADSFYASNICYIIARVDFNHHSSAASQPKIEIPRPIFHLTNLHHSPHHWVTWKRYHHSTLTPSCHAWKESSYQTITPECADVHSLSSILCHDWKKNKNTNKQPTLSKNSYYNNTLTLT